MNEDTLIAVCGYRGDKHQVQNNLPLYLHHGCPVVVLSPSDAPITFLSDPKVHCQWFGRKGWIGAHTLERQRLYFEAMLKFPQKYFLMHDADSIMLSPKIPDYLYRSDVWWSNEVLDTNPGPSYLPKLAFQPPYFFSRVVLERMYAASHRPAPSYYGPPINPDGWPMPYPTECLDHWFLQVVYAAGVAHRTFPDGASFETASPHGLAVMSGLVRQHGKTLLHSVKTKRALDTLRRDHETFCRSRA